MIWLTIYLLGVFGFGGILFALGQDDFSPLESVLMALGWPLLAVVVLVGVLATL